MDIVEDFNLGEDDNQDDVFNAPVLTETSKALADLLQSSSLTGEAEQEILLMAVNKLSLQGKSTHFISQKLGVSRHKVNSCKLIIQENQKDWLGALDFKSFIGEQFNVLDHASKSLIELAESTNYTVTPRDKVAALRAAASLSLEKLRILKELGLTENAKSLIANDSSVVPVRISAEDANRLENFILDLSEETDEERTNKP